MTRARRALRLFSLLGCAAVVSCGPGPRATVYGDAAVLPDAALPDDFPACDLAAETQTVTFVQSGDTHASYHLDAPGESPMSRIRGFYEWTRWEQPFTLFVDSGDANEKGSVAELLSGGVATREVVWALGYDVRVLGNHDYAWSLEETLAYSHDPRALVLASNTTYLGADATAFGAVAFGELEVGCVRVGFFGLVGLPWDAKNDQHEAGYYPELETRHDYVDRAQELVDANRASVDLLVMVSHLGLGLDREVAAAVGGIDVVLGGHSHDALLEPSRRGDALIVHSGAYAEFVGRLSVEVRLSDGAVVDHHYELVLNRPGTLPVPLETQQAVEDVLAAWAPEAALPVAWLASPQPERGVARLAARAAVSELGVDAALVDVDTVRASWAAGPLTPQQMADAFPDERQPPGTPSWRSFYRVTLTGAELDALTGLSSQWVLELPLAPDPLADYEVAVQKHVALHPADVLPLAVEPTDATPLQEVWQTLDGYGRRRTGDCLHLDDDTPLDGC